MHSEEFRYLDRRAGQEIAAARHASCPIAARVHLQLATFYLERLYIDHGATLVSGRAVEAQRYRQKELGIVGPGGKLHLRSARTLNHVKH